MKDTETPEFISTEKELTSEEQAVLSQVSKRNPLELEAYRALEDVPTYFTTDQELTEFIESMKFFDADMNMIRSEIDKISLDNPEGVYSLNKEFWVMQRMLNIQKYKTKGYYAEPFKKIIIKGERATAPLGIIPRVGMHMTTEDWDQYERVFDELFVLEKQ